MQDFQIDIEDASQIVLRELSTPRLNLRTGPYLQTLLFR